MIDNYCLVNLVDNDFPKDSCLFEIISKTRELQKMKGLWLHTVSVFEILHKELYAKIHDRGMTMNWHSKQREAIQKLNFVVFKI